MKIAELTGRWSVARVIRTYVLRTFTVLLAAVVTLVVFAIRVPAQTTSATISGLIADSSGAVVADADVQLLSVLQGITASTKTNSAGLYIFPSVQPGMYQIKVNHAGFKQVDILSLIVNVQDHIEQNVRLQVGSVSESVTVNANDLHINTTDATVSTVVDRQFADNLPMNGRSFQTLIQLAPGVVLATPNGGDNGQFNINGQRSASNYWMVDGVSANIGAGSGVGGKGQGVGGAVPGLSVQGGTNSLVSVDALQEFRLQTSTYAPEFGRMPGGQISIVTRSGTNEFHGTAFEYLRNDALDANDWFANFTKQPKPPERQNDFGGTLGGPIVKDRTFFFLSYEGLRLRLPQVALSTVPSLSARQAAIAATQPLLNAFALPNGTDFGDGTAQFNASYSNASTLDAGSVRIDHKLTERLTLFGRYNYSPSNLVSRSGGFSSLSDLTGFTTKLQTVTVGSTWMIEPTISTDIRLNYSRNKSNLANTLDSFGGAIPLTGSQLSLPSPFNTDNSTSAVIIFPVGVLLDGHTGGFLQQQFNFVGSMSLQRRSHSLKVGIDYRRLTPSWSPFLYNLSSDFLDMSSVETGNLLLSFVQSQRNAALELQNLGTFAQDMWRVSSRLTLTYGVRWDLDFTPSSSPAFPAFTNFNISDLSTLALAPAGTQPYSTTYGNVAPRVGAAFQVSRRPGFETVVRGGFGVFYDLASQEVGNALSQSLYPFGAQSRVIGGNYPLPSSQLAPPPIAVDNIPISGTRGFDPHLKLPYSLQWNIAVEQALGGRQTIAASYVGAVGRRLLQTADIFAPNPAFAETSILTNAATSDYHALQLQFQRRLSRGLQVLASYTWSHSIDTASAGSWTGNFGNDFVPGLDPNTERGPSDFDIRNAFSTGVTYAIPSPRIDPVAKALFSGWSVQNAVQAHSAPPVNVYYSSFSDSNALNAQLAIRPDVVPPGQPLYLSGTQCLAPRSAGGLGAPCPGGKGFNPNAFMSPPVDQNGNPLRQGNLSRNALRGFGVAQWDLAVHRDFPISEALKLQFRVEMFNVLNHPNFGPPIGDLRDPMAINHQFGQSTQMLNQSLGAAPGVGSFSALYQTGGPRSVQLALKLTF